jgi:hypothetical protein
MEHPMKIKITVTREAGESEEQLARAKQEALRMVTFAFEDHRKMALSGGELAISVTAEGVPFPTIPPAEMGCKA